ncbi:MAG: nucleotide excision repair endonuclease [Proteobacteria bacterium]|nr:MAG: nucleotide excision repair endonuclease [Pseudomonadota bacterium]
MNADFDRKLGPDFIATVPDQSGVYLFKDENGAVIYVGKAKSLKKRLSQYRLAARRKQTRKMRKIVKAAVSLEFQICDSEKAALLLENELILKFKPVLNIAGAFSFLYPYLGLKRHESEAHYITICYTTSPKILADLGFEMFGAFRSRDSVIEAYEAFAFLLTFIGHHTASERKQYGDIPYTRIITYRQMREGWLEDMRSLLRGESNRCLSRLMNELLEKPDARRMAADIQLHLKSLKYFFASEAVKLRSALDQHGIDQSMIDQEERDRLFIALS